MAIFNIGPLEVLFILFLLVVLVGVPVALGVVFYLVFRKK